MIISLKNISAITIGIVLASNVAVYASTKTDISNYKNVNGSDMVDKTSCKKISFKTNVFEKLGITKEDIENGRKSGKNIFDIAKEKGHSEADVKKLMIEEKVKYIDDEVQRGAIPKEKGEKIKAHFKERIEKWDGSLKDNKCSKPLNKNDTHKR